ncbi:hypothetical protein QUB46_10330 [Microcoleus sp. A6-D1]
MTFFSSHHVNSIALSENSVDRKSPTVFRLIAFFVNNWADFYRRLRFGCP